MVTITKRLPSPTVVASTGCNTNSPNSSPGGSAAPSAKRHLSYMVTGAPTA